MVQKTPGIIFSAQLNIPVCDPVCLTHSDSDTHEPKLHNVPERGAVCLADEITGVDRRKKGWPGSS